jgi:hypothetical protein
MDWCCLQADNMDVSIQMVNKRHLEGLIGHLGGRVDSGFIWDIGSCKSEGTTCQIGPVLGLGLSTLRFVTASSPKGINGGEGWPWDRATGRNNSDGQACLLLLLVSHVKKLGDIRILLAKTSHVVVTFSFEHRRFGTGLCPNLTSVKPLSGTVSSPTFKEPKSCVWRAYIGLEKEMSLRCLT